MEPEAPREALDLPAGTVLFREGDPGEEMFVIERGRIRLTLGPQDMEVEIAILQPGDFFGELSLLGGARRTATATATDATRLLVIRRDTFAMMMQDDLEVVFRMMDALGSRLAQTDRQVHDLLHARARARVAADLLGRCVAAGGSDGAVSLDELSRGWGVTPKSLQSTLDDLAARGAGTFANGRWTVRGNEDVSRLIAALLSYLR